jgi:hypothetical protein
LVDSDTDTDIREIFNGEVLDLGYLPTNLNIRAEVAFGFTRVVFYLNGIFIWEDPNYPFALGSDIAGDYLPAFALRVLTSSLRVKAVPYVGSVFFGGTPGEPGEIDIAIVNTLDV